MLSPTSKQHFHDTCMSRLEARGVDFGAQMLRIRQDFIAHGQPSSSRAVLAINACFITAFRECAQETFDCLMQWNEGEEPAADVRARTADLTTQMTAQLHMAFITLNGLRKARVAPILARLQNEGFNSELQSMVDRELPRALKEYTGKVAAAALVQHRRSQASPGVTVTNFGKVGSIQTGASSTAHVTQDASVSIESANAHQGQQASIFDRFIRPAIKWIGTVMGTVIAGYALWLLTR